LYKYFNFERILSSSIFVEDKQMLKKPFFHISKPTLDTIISSLQYMKRHLVVFDFQF